MKKLVILIFLIITLPVKANEIHNSDYFLNEIKTSLTLYEQNTKSSKIYNDKAFYKLQKKYENTVFDMNRKDVDNISTIKCENHQGKYKIVKDEEKQKFDTQKYYDKGLGFFCSEAMSIYRVDYNWLYRHYGQGLSKEYKQWLFYLKNPVLFEEGLLNSNKKTLIKNIKQLEKFAETYPNFVGIEDVLLELNKLKNAI